MWLGGMKALSLVLLLSLATPLTLAREGTVLESEISLGGIAIGDSPSEVTNKLGLPLRKVEELGFLSLHYYYPQVRVSFSENVVAELYSDKAAGCTPRQLCPGDPLDKMRSLYGPPVIADREAGRFYEYYAADFTCWLQIRSKGKRISSIAVVCMP
jgi:hypothetical protein